MIIRRTLQVLLCLVLGVAISLTPAPAQADDEYPVTVDVTTVSPAQLSAGQSSTIEISGTITNISATPMTWVTAEFWHLPTTITTPEALQEVTSAESEQPSGTRLRDTEAGTMVTLRQDAPLEPGASAAFSIRATTEQLGITGPGAHAIGVHVRALTSAGSVTTVGVNRWVMPVLPDKVAYTAISVLTAKPTMTAPRTFINDRLASELTGRLEDLLTLAERPGAAFLIDPALVDEVKALTEEHTVAGISADPVPAAASWLERLTAIVQRGTGFRLPYGNPDLTSDFVAEQQTALAPLLSAAQPDSSSGNLVAKLPTAVFGGPSSVLASFNPAPVVFSPEVSGHNEHLVQTTPFAITNLAPGAKEKTHLRRLQTAQEIVASLVDRPAVRLISSDLDVAAETALNAPWRILTPLSELPATRQARYQPGIPAPIVPPLREHLASWLAGSNLGIDLSGIRTGYRAAQMMFKGMSVQSPSDEATIYLTSANPYLPQEKMVVLRGQPSVVMAARDNQFPLSVTNRSTMSIRVKISFTSSNPRRINIKGTDVIELAAGETASVNAEAHATSNGLVSVSAQLTTVAGRGIGESHQFEITSTDAGRIGWVIIVASAIVVVGGTAWRIRAVQRERTAKDTA